MHLAIEGGRFTESGREIRLKGASVPSFLWYNDWANLESFQWRADTLAQWGANFITVKWNAGLLSDPQYVEDLTKAVEYARRKGLRVELVLHSRGFLNQTDPAIIQYVDRQVLADWDRLLSSEGTAARLVKQVDIWGVLSEPLLQHELNNEGTRDLAWHTWKAVFEESCEAIRIAIKDPRAICAMSGVGGAADISGQLTGPVRLGDVAFEVHRYQHMDASHPQALTWRNAIASALVFMGEFGWDDPLPYTKELLDYMGENRISWAVWTMMPFEDRGLIQADGKTPTALGTLVKGYFQDED